MDVIVNDGSFQGINDTAYAKGFLPTSFEGVPVEVHTVDNVDMTGEGSAL